ncbi:MAG: hypothetical protein ACI8ZX_001202 [Planctomycetota bacterium]|jgi:hypothetical protein
MELIGIVFFIISSFFSNEIQHIATEKTMVTIDPNNKTIEVFQQNLFTVFEKPSDSIAILNELSLLGKNEVLWSEKLSEFPEKTFKLIHDKKNDQLHLQISLKFKDNVDLKAFAFDMFQEKYFSIVNIPYWNLSSEDGKLNNNYWQFPLDQSFTFTLNPFKKMPKAFQEQKQNLLPLWKQTKKLKKN